MNTSVLAYVGDAVYEIRIREMVVRDGPPDPQRLHRMAVRYVSAEGQAHAARELLASGFLAEDEARLLRRGRNHRVSSQPRHAYTRDYKYATGLEALLGYLHLAGHTERLNEVIDEAIRIIDSEGDNVRL